MIHTEFYDWLKNYCNLAETSSRSYTNRVDRFGRKFGDIRRLNDTEVYNIITDEAKSVSDHNVWVSALKKYEEFLDFNGEDHSFSKKLKSKTPDKQLPKPLTENEISRIVEQIPTEGVEPIRDRAIIELLYCGLRNSECCNVKISDFSDQTVLIKGKGSKERLVPINKEAWNFVTKYAVLKHGNERHKRLARELGHSNVFKGVKNTKEDQFLFLTSTNVQMYPRKVRKIVDKYSKKAGVEGAYPHRFRHSFATHSLDRGLGNLIALKDVLGHESLDMVMRYAQTTRSGRDLVRSFHPRQNE